MAHNSWPAESGRQGVRVNVIRLYRRPKADGHELYNVQIVLEEYSSDASFQLCDEDGEFLTVPSADADHCSEGDELYEEMASGSFGEERNEVELLRQSVTDTHSRKG